MKYELESRAVMSLTRPERAQEAQVRENYVPDVTETVGTSLPYLDKDIDYKRIFENLPVAIIVLCKDGRVTKVNKFAEQLLGVDAEGAKWQALIGSLISPKPDDGHDISLKNGKRVNMATFSLAPTPGQVIILTDVTETRALQDVVNHYERLSAIGSMVASLAHQIRTPLAAAILYIGKLELSLDENSTSFGYTRKISRKLNQLETRIRELLLFARGDELNAEAVTTADLNEMIKESIGSKTIPNLKSSDNRVIMVQPEIIKSIVENIVTNAYEANAKEVKCKTFSNNRAFTIEITDDGDGICHEHLSKVVTPFFTTKPTGTGLGLAIAKKILDKLNAKLEIASEKGAGTCVSIHIPLINDQQPEGTSNV